MTFVKLTREDHTPVWINPKQVCSVSVPIASVSPPNAKAHIQLANGFTYVIDDIDRVIYLLHC